MATSAEVGNAVIKLSFDDSGVKSGLDSAEKTTSSFGQKVKNVASGIGKALAAGFATATAAAVAFSKKSIEAFNTQEEALAKLEQVAINQNWADTAVESLKAYNSELQKTGIIGDEVMLAGQAQLGTFALSEEAVKKITPAMNDLIAATSGYSATTESATSMANLMGKVMTGSVSALTRYGVTLDDNQKKLLEEGDEMTRASVLAEVLAQNYGHFNEKLAQTPQGKVKQLSNAFGDLKESFGAFLAGEGDLEEFFNTLDTVATQAIDLFVTMAPQIIDGITKLITEIGKKLPGIIKELTPVITKAVIDLAMALVELIPDFLDAWYEIQFALLDAIIENLPAILNAVVNVVIAIAQKLTSPEMLSKMLTAAIELFMTLVECIPDILVALIEALPDIIANIVAFLTDPDNIMKIIEATVQLFMGIVKAVPKIIGALLEAFAKLFVRLWETLKTNFGKFVTKFGDFIKDIFKGAINGVLGFLENVVNAPIRLLNGFIGIINGAFGWLGVNIGEIGLIQLPRLAQGGIANGATPVMIGEAGKEAVLPLENNTDNWSGLLASALAEEMQQREFETAPVTIYMTNEINSKLDIAEVSRGLVQEIRRLS